MKENLFKKSWNFGRGRIFEQCRKLAREAPSAIQKIPSKNEPRRARAQFGHALNGPTPKTKNRSVVPPYVHLRSQNRHRHIIEFVRVITMNVFDFFDFRILVLPELVPKIKVNNKHTKTHRIFV